MGTQLALRETASSSDGRYLAAVAEKVEMRAWKDVVNAAPLWLRISLDLVAEESDGVLLLASRGIPSLLFNRVIGLGGDVPVTERQIGQIMDRYWTLGVSNYWIHAGPFAQPMRLGGMLQAQGLSLYRRSWVKMVRPARKVQVEESEIHVRPARIEDAHRVASIVGPAFDLPQRAAEMFAHLIDRPHWHVFVAELRGEVIAAAGLFIEDEMAYLAFAATRMEHRRLGSQRALMQARINVACDEGCRWITTETGFPLAADEPNPSYHNMLWAGFRPVEIRDNYAPPGTQWRRSGFEAEVDEATAC